MRTEEPATGTKRLEAGGAENHSPPDVAGDLRTRKREGGMVSYSANSSLQKVGLAGRSDDWESSPIEAFPGPTTRSLAELIASGSVNQFDSSIVGIFDRDSHWSLAKEGKNEGLNRRRVPNHILHEYTANIRPSSLYAYQPNPLGQMLDFLQANRVFVAENEAQILELEAQITALQRSIVQLRGAQRAAKQRLSSYKYPVLTLPNEILGEIFIHFLPPYPDPPPLVGNLSPICLDLLVWVETVTNQIRAQLEEHEAIARLELMNDGLDPEGDEVPECRVILSIDVQIANHHLLDHIEWGLLSPLTPEDFAKTLCCDLGLAGEAVPVIAHAVHEELMKHKKDAVEWGIVDGGGMRDKTGLGLASVARGRGPKPLESVWRD
ncbi:hypothetical protein R3P38DRAFT_3470482 [Favolaschia claudopus]|uniref:Uncharacterized protein n=1 Tax=Favolaschia claudopus TaxID=2862362 RepID=A0AAV9ZCQ4_9AGAR